MEKQLVLETLRHHWWQIGLMVLGAGLLVTGMVMLAQQTRGDQLEIVQSPAPSSSVQLQVIIDVAGAVERPGVYRLPTGSRIGEAIIAAGGLAARANRAFVAQSLNQAEVVRDGMKIFIPEEGPSPSGGTELNGISDSLNRLISVNTASEADLDSLWGIGAARAKTIVENRPYGTLQELTTKAKIPQEVLDRNQGKLGL